MMKNVQTLFFDFLLDLLENTLINKDYYLFYFTQKIKQISFYKLSLVNLFKTG